MEDGSTKVLKDIEIGDKIKTDNGYNSVLAKTEISKQMVYQVKTKSGKILKMSKLHTVPVYDNLGNIIDEKNISGGLSVGDLIYTND